MSKHQEILSYLEELPIGKRVSVRSISNHLGVSDGTAYRAIKEAENRGIVETRPRSGTIRVKSQKVAIERLTYAEIAEVTSSEVLAGQEGLEREFSKFSIGAMTEQNILSYLHDGGLLIVGDRTRIQLLALENENAVLVTGGFHVQDDVLTLANKKGIPVLRSKHDTFTVATMINKALSNVQIKTDILTVDFPDTILTKFYNLVFYITVTFCNKLTYIIHHFFIVSYFRNNYCPYFINFIQSC